MTRAQLKSMAKAQIKGNIGILYIWLIPYMQATVANFYRSLTAKTTVEG